MAETRRKFDQDFKEGAVRLVRETGKPIAQVARDLGLHDGTLGNWVNADLSRHSPGDLAAVAAALNGRPRKTLGWKTPAESLDESLYSCQQADVATTP